MKTAEDTDHHSARAEKDCGQNSGGHQGFWLSSGCFQGSA
jgi:hypothetical protein